MNAETFNRLYPIGTPVVAYPGARPEDDSNDERLVTRTRSKAEVLGGHTDVVWVHGHGACINLTHVDVVTDTEPITDLATAVEVMGALPMPAGPAPATPRWQQARTELIRTFRDYMPETAATKATDLLDEAIAERAEGQRPNRYRATPAEVDWFLRKILTEETLLNYQRAIGNRATEEAAEDLRIQRRDHDADVEWLEAADWIDPAKDGGHYPSQLLCAKHDGFNPCPGAPRCTPREDEEAGR